MFPLHRLLTCALLCTISSAAFSQSEPDCSYNPDFDGDGAIGVTDLLGFLGFYGDENSSDTCNFGPDVDCDGICDAFDDCIGAIDECGVCGGEGAFFPVIDTIIPVMDSVFIDCLGGYHVYQAWADTTYNHVCPTYGCTDSEAYNYDPDMLVDDGSCQYASPGCNDGTLTVDFDGHAYDVVTIGDQCWFAENLRSSHFVNGDEIPELAADSLWAQLVYNEKSARCYLDNDSTNASLGLIYSHYAIMDGRNICPPGWKVPSRDDWQELKTALGPNEDVMSQKLMSTPDDEIPWNGWNSTGFSAHPFAFRRQGGGFQTTNRLWTSSNWSAYAGGTETINPNGGPVTYSSRYKPEGLQVRCMQIPEGTGFFDPDQDEVAPSAEVYGCMDDFALNFNPLATEPDSCATIGCMDIEAYNFDLNAVQENSGACKYATATCEELSSVNYHGYEYSITQIGEQCWFAENLRTELYTNGDSIANNIPDSVWMTLNYGAIAAPIQQTCSSCSADSAVAVHGFLYNGFAVQDDRGLCPTGWQVSTLEQWNSLEAELGMTELEILEQNGPRRGENRMAGAKLASKPTDATPWFGVNSTSLSMTPSGWREAWSGGYSNNNTTRYWYREPNGNYSMKKIQGTPSGRGLVFRQTYGYNFGVSVRCVKED